MRTIHPFHFTLDMKTILLLMAAGGLEEFKKLPKFLAELLQQFYWYVEWFHLEGPSQRCRYKRISDDLTDERKKMWLPLPEELYQQLKSVHKDQDFYSIGQIIRKVICLYLRMREQGSHEWVMGDLTRLQQEWQRKRGEYKKVPQKDASAEDGPGFNSKISFTFQHIRSHRELERGNFLPYWVIYNSQAIPEGIYLR